MSETEKGEQSLKPTTETPQKNNVSKEGKDAQSPNGLAWFLGLVGLGIAAYFVIDYVRKKRKGVKDESGTGSTDTTD